MTAADWRRTRLSRAVAIRSGRDFAAVDDPHGKFPVFGSGGRFARASEYLYSGHGVIFGRKGTIDRPIPVTGEFWVTDTGYFVEPMPGLLDARFLSYWSLRFPFRYYATDTALPSMTRSDIGSEPINLPPLSTQVDIADYLDHETAEIDALVADFTKLRATTDERWKSIRDQLVWSRTDGTSRDLAPLKYFFGITLGKMLDERKHNLDSDYFAYLRAGNIADGDLDLTDVKRMPFSTGERNKYRLVAGDMLVVEGGSIGTNVVLTEDLPDTYFQKTLLRLRARSGVSPNFYSEAINSLRDNGALTLETGRATIAHLPAEKLAELRVPHLDSREQHAVARALQATRARTTELQADLSRAIALAKERRAALITAAVTGQIDVTATRRPAAEQLEDDIKELT